jgi:predicted acetyltransferase
MSVIQPIPPEDFDEWVTLYLNAFPGEHPVRSPEHWNLTKEHLLALGEEPTAGFYGLYRHGRLFGGMCVHDYTMNFFGTPAPVGGVGHLSVHLAHKKEHIAKELVTYWLERCRERGQILALLHPFRPDFYRRMGFGYGPKMSQFRLRPSALPRGPSKSSVRLVGPDEVDAVVECYTRYARRTHGMIEMTAWDANALRRPELLIAGYERAGRLEGYVTFTFEPGEHSLYADMHVWDLIAETPDALSELLTFLHSQADQIRYITFETLDETLHFVLADPRWPNQGLIPPAYHPINRQGVGLMVRVTDVRRALELLRERDWGGQTCRLSLRVADSFLPANAACIRLGLEGGQLRLDVTGDPQVELCLDVSEFSALLYGAVPLRRLVRYGLAQVSDPAYVDVLDRAFAVRDAPVCLTRF